MVRGHQAATEEAATSAGEAGSLRDLAELRHLLALYQEQVLADDRLIRGYQDVSGLTPEMLRLTIEGRPVASRLANSQQRLDLMLLAAPKRYARPGYLEQLERETRRWTAVALRHPLTPTLWLDLFRLQRRRARRNRRASKTA